MPSLQHVHIFEIPLCEITIHRNEIRDLPRLATTELMLRPYRLCPFNCDGSQNLLGRKLRNDSLQFVKDIRRWSDYL